MRELAWLKGLTAWAETELEHTARVLDKAGDADPVAKSRNGHGSPRLNRAMVRGARRRRGWLGR